MELQASWHNQNIAYIEINNILVALKVRNTQWKGSKVLTNSDNQAIVSVLTTGKTRDSITVKYARNIFLWLSASDIDIVVVPIPGKMNPLADLLSRWHITVNNISAAGASHNQDPYL